MSPFLLPYRVAKMADNSQPIITELVSLVYRGGGHATVEYVAKYWKPARPYLEVLRAACDGFSDLSPCIFRLGKCCTQVWAFRPTFFS